MSGEYRLDSTQPICTQPSMTPTTPRYPGDKGFLTVPIDDVQLTTERLRYISDSQLHEFPPSTPSLLLLPRIPMTEVLA